MRRQVFTLIFLHAHFPTFNPTSVNLHVVSQVCLTTTDNNSNLILTTFSESLREYGSLMPHPLRAKANGRMVYCYVTVGTFARRGLSSTAKTLRSLSGVRGSEY